MSDSIIYLKIFKDRESGVQAEALGSEKQGAGVHLETKEKAGLINRFATEESYGGPLFLAPKFVKLGPGSLALREEENEV